jgi:hypothetical protein
MPVPADPSRRFTQGINQPGPGEHRQTPGATPRKEFRIPELRPGVNEMPRGPECQPVSASRRSKKRTRRPGIQSSPLSQSRSFVAHLHAWEAKTKAEKKSRRPPSPNPNRNPARDAKASRRPRRSRTVAASVGGLRLRHGKGIPVRGRIFLRIRLVFLCTWPVELCLRSSAIYVAAAMLLAATLLLAVAVAQEPATSAPAVSALPAVEPPGRAAIGVALGGVAEPWAWRTSASLNGLRGIIFPSTASPAPAHPMNCVFCSPEAKRPSHAGEPSCV